MPAKSASKSMRAKNKKPAVKSSALFFNIFIAVAVLICLLTAFNNYMITGQRKERLENLDSEYNSVRIKNEALRNKLEASTLDEDYIISFARANGLRKDNEILFYLYPER